jgi:hypothetical protein
MEKENVCKEVPQEEIDNKYKSFRDLILKEDKKGNIVFMSTEGPIIAPIQTFIQQPIDGVLYDLNRIEEVTLTQIEDKKWVNDFAVAKVIRQLKLESERWKTLYEQEKECHDATEELLSKIIETETEKNKNGMPYFAAWPEFIVWGSLSYFTYAKKEV